MPPARWPKPGAASGASSFDAVITDMRLPDGLGLELLHRMPAGAARRALHRDDGLRLGRERRRGAQGRRLRLPDQAGGPQAVPQRRGLGDPGQRRRRRARGRPQARPRQAGNGDRAPARGKPRWSGWWATPQPMRAGQGAHRQGGAQHGAGAGARRVGHRQGTGGARRPCLQPSRRRPLRRRQLQRHSRERCWKPNSSARARAPTPAPAQDRDGYFQAARGGTLFLDEIGDLPLAMQSKLLRAIQERQVRPLGSTQEDAVDVRIVSATHKDLAADVQAGRFRQDLFYRLNVIEIAGAAAARAPRRPARAVRGAAGAHRAATPACRCRVLSPSVLQQLCGTPAARQCARTGEPAAPRRGAVRRRGTAGGFRARRRRRLRRAAGAPTAPSRGRADSPNRPSCRRQCPRDLQAYLDQQEREILVRGAAGKRLQPHRRRAAPGPEPAADPLPHRAPGHRDAQRRRSPMTTRPETARAALWRAGWYRFARQLRFAQLRAAARRRADRPDRAAFDQPAARPLRRRRSAAAVHQHAGLGRPPVLQEHRAACRSRRISTSGATASSGSSSAATTAPGMPAPRTGAAATNCNDDSDRHRAGRPGGRAASSRRSTRPWPACAPRIAQHYPVAHIAGHEHIAPGRKHDPGAGFDWALLQRSLAWPQTVFPAASTLNFHRVHRCMVRRTR